MKYDVGMFTSDSLLNAIPFSEVSWYTWKQIVSDKCCLPVWEGRKSTQYIKCLSLYIAGFQVRIKPDKHSTANFFGFLEVQVSGLWGSVCARGFDDKAATVACRQLGFAGGAAYNPPKNISSPLLMDNIQCVGSEESLLKCAFSNWYVYTGCDYYSDRAGVLCYNDTGNYAPTVFTT